MTQLVNGIVVGLTTFLVVLGIVSYALKDDPGGAPESTPELELRSVAADWGTVDALGSELEFFLSVANGHPDPARLTEVQYDVYLDDARILQEAHPASGVVGPGAEALLQASLFLPAEFPTIWWTGFVENQESSVLTVDAVLLFDRGSGNDTLPFTWTTEWSFNWSQTIEEQLDNCANDTQVLCVERGTVSWVVSAADAVYLTLGLELYNPTDSAAILQGGTNQLSLEGVLVASGDGPRGVRVEPNASAHVEVALRFDPLQFQGWWPRHVSECERSGALLAIDWTVESLSGDQGETTTSALRWEWAEIPFESRFVCGQN